MGKGSSESSQKAEGDVVFNNVDYGGQGSGAGSLKNFNVGRENRLQDNVFNITDGGSTRNALAANAAATAESNKTSQWAVGNNAVVAGKAIDAGTDGQLINAQVAANAIDEVNKTASEAVKAAERAAEQQAKSAREAAANARAMAGDLANFAKQTSGDTFDFTNNVLGTYENLVTRTGNQIAETLDYSEGATGRALDYVFASTQNASERTSENILKYSGYAAAGLAVVGLYLATRGR